MDLAPSSPEYVTKDLSTITDEDVMSIRTALDKTSWTLFGMNIASDEGNVLRIDYLNRTLIESFDWFATAGLKSIFDNKELKIPNIGIVRFHSHVLHSPRKDELGDSNSYLWPHEAEMEKKDYSGALMVRAEITWIERSTKVGTEDIGEIQLGKIPIMVGSSFCNLTNRELIRTKKDLVAVKACPDDYLGYFIMGGHQKNLIAQNYSKPNNETVILSKMGSTTHYKTVCNIRTKAIDGTMGMHKVFVMTSAVNKVKSSDRRLYAQIGALFKKNAYDASTTIIGINVVSIFRMATIMMHYMNPLIPESSYRFVPLDPNPDLGIPGIAAGFNGVSTFDESVRYFVTFIREYAGENLWKSASRYVVDTINEASLEEDELDFWNVSTTVENLESKDKSVTEKATSMLDSFSQQFMIHIGNAPLSIQRKALEEMKFKLRQNISGFHRTKGISTDPKEIDLSLYYISQILEVHSSGNTIDADTMRKQLIEARGVVITDAYTKVLRFYNEMRSDILAKMKLLAYMCVKVLRVEMGVDALDDRDSLSNQMYEHAGILMTSRYVSMLKQVERELSVVTADAKSINTQLTRLGKNIITAEFGSNFSHGEWNKRGVDKKRTGVTDTMPSSVTIARLSYLRRLSAQSKGHSKNTASRELTGLQVGFVCLSETPEGTQCGNVEHLAAAAFITNESYDSTTLAYKLTQLRTSRRRDQVQVADMLSADSLRNKLANMTGLTTGDEKDKNQVELLISTGRTPDRSTPMFMDGRPMGWVNGLSFRRLLISWRREGSLHPHTGIHYIQKVTKTSVISQLKIETTGGRIVQPLIISEDPKATLNMLWKLNMDFQNDVEITVSDLVEQGFIEFVDSAELEFLDLAPSVTVYLQSIQDGLPERYDHIMLNPAFLKGPTANLQPFANMNPVVRNSYFTNMAKQPVDVPSPTYVERADTSIGKLLTPQEPLVKTDMYDSIFRNDYFGMNVNLLITPHREGEEDGLVVNRNFLDNGGLSSVKYSTFPIGLEAGDELEFGKDFMSTETDPDKYGRGIIRVKRKVVTKNDDGTVTITEEPVIVKPHELLARKTKMKTDEKSYEDVSFDSLRDGIVDRILWSKSSTSSKIVYIIIRMPDNLWVGDKVASRYSQKGVIAKVINNEEMPYNAETGERADMIMNPQSFPSRMTVGMLAEILVANAHIYPDKNKNVFTLFNMRGFDLFAPLERIFVVDENLWNAYRFDDGHVHHVNAPAPDGIPDMNPIGQVDVGSMLLTGGPGLILPQTPAIETSKVKIISSDEANSQGDMEFLKANDMANKMPETKNGLWVLRFYADPLTEEEQGGFKPSEVIRYILLILKSDGLVKMVESSKVTDGLYAKFPEMRERVSFILEVPIEHIEIVKGLFFDTEKNIDGEKVNPQLGFRVSKLPILNLSTVGNNPYPHLGESIQEIYVRGNTYTPVPNQLVAGYKDSFFIRSNIRASLYDFIIPDSMRVLEDIISPEENFARTITFPAGTKFSNIVKEKSPIKALEWQNNVIGGKIQYLADGVTPVRRQVEVETTVLEAWTRKYPDSLMIPRENVINLPNDAVDVFISRRKKIENLRQATIFKEGLDVTDAMKELELMGYSPDMKSKFINPKTGKLIEGGIVSGWSYYMPLRHKVKNKMQARGFGKNDSRTGQPGQGRNKGGGLRFNFADALAVIKSGASNFVNDRLLDSSGKKDVFVCVNCREICYRQGAKGAMMGSIVCPLCKTEAEAIKISIPYIFLLTRSLLMGAGVRLKIEPAMDDFEVDDPGFYQDKL